MIALRLGLGNFDENSLFRDDTAQSLNDPFEVFQCRQLGGVAFGIPHGGEAVILYLTDALARDAVLLPDGIKRAALPLLGEAESIGKDLAGTLRKPCEQVFGDCFW